MLNRLLSLTKNLRTHLLIVGLALVALTVALGVVPVAYAEDAAATDATATAPAATDPAAATPVATDPAVVDPAAAPAATDPAAAGTVAMTSDVPEGCILMGNDLICAGRNPSVSAYQAANDILGAGDNVTVSDSNVAGSIRLAGHIITLTNAVAGESITIAGQEITITGGSANAVALAAQNITFSGTANELWLTGDTVIIDGVVTGNVHVNANKVELGANAQIGGTLSGEVSAQPEIAAEATVADDQLEVTEAQSGDIKSMLDPMYIAFNVASCLAIALLAEWVASNHTVGAGELLKSSAGGYLGAALIGAIVVPIAIALLCVPVVTIPAALATLFALIAIMLVCNGFTAAALGRMIFPRMGRYKAVALMGIVVGLLCGMPYAGIAVRGLTYLFMLGYAVRSLRVGMLQRREERDQEVVQF